MSEQIIPVNMLKQHNMDYSEYIIYLVRHRVLPNPIDGLKNVHRRILYSLFKDFHMNKHNCKTIKTSRVSGHVIGKYHPHGPASVEDAIKPMVNWFEIYCPLIRAQGGYGSMYGDKQSAARYTEVALSDYALDCIVSELNETPSSVDWRNNYDNSCKEPVYFPAAVPNLLINGTSGIAVGMVTELPKHNISEVIAETIKVIHNPRHQVFLIPDNCMGSDIIATNFKDICNTGKGKFKVRGRLEITEWDYGRGGKYPALKVLSMPDRVFFKTVKEEIEKLVESNKMPQVHEILNNTTLDKKTKEENFEVYIVLKREADPAYVREMVYNMTSMESTVPVDFEVILGKGPALLSYTHYINLFLNARREAKFRVYTNKLQESKTNIHKYELYLYAMKSGKIRAIQDKVYDQKKADDAKMIEAFTKSLKVTPLQAKFLLDLGFKKLSLGYMKKYEELVKEEKQKADLYFYKVTHTEELDKEIEEELKEINKRYGCPRRSRVISREEASQIPGGMFKVVITENNHIKKVDINERIGSLGGDREKFIIPIDNRDSITIFGATGKVFEYPVHKIPFSPKGTAGMDIKVMINGLTADIACAIPKSSLQAMASNPKIKYYVYTISNDSYLKRMDMDDFIDVPSNKGLVYCKLDEGDYVKDIVFMPAEFDLLIYSHNKAIRLSGEEAPYIRRTTKGYSGMRTSHDVDGMECIYPGATNMVVVTKNGRINKLPLDANMRSSRGKSGSAVIKLGKTDRIKRILICKPETIIQLENSNYATLELKAGEIRDGSSISAGEKPLAGELKSVIKV